MINEQIISRDRVIDHGEVFTSEREVNDMLDLVKDETEKIDSIFLEPACGTGNFLVEIIRRKLCIVFTEHKKLCDKNPYNRSYYRKNLEINILKTVSSIYGIDILLDNVKECRQRLFDIIYYFYIDIFSKYLCVSYFNSVCFILNKNIICGDALSYKTIEKNAIVFYEWKFDEYNISAIGNTLEDILSTNKIISDKDSLFDEHNINLNNTTDAVKSVYYLRLGDSYNNI